ncbi:MAG: hypothetical protein UZ17_ACD001002007 [Acidobacteria bacterium OLB17]|nr:MAG: hypothetical protein UZ17_ACD001002007 [Acidobacteria bacterium OLB17]
MPPLTLTMTITPPFTTTMMRTSITHFLRTSNRTSRRGR